MKQNLQLYIHIPFCLRKCYYCDFLSAPLDDLTRKAYLSALNQEIKQMSWIGEPFLVDTVFIGGGTPSLLHARDLEAILSSLKETFSFASPCEISIEANPGTLNKKKLKDLRAAGFNRLSLGLQSTDNTELALLGRIHTYEVFLENYHWAREASFTNINVDLMSALPGQSLKSWQSTLSKIAELNPEHISAYSLIIEENTPFFELYSQEDKLRSEGKSPKLLPDEETERSMFHLSGQLLKEFGYEHYEISNYAKPSQACRHNIGYWTGVPYLGLGLGASSYLHGIRFQNTTQMNNYLKQSADTSCIKTCLSSQNKNFMSRLANYRKQAIQELDKEERMEEFMILGLRLLKGVSEKEFEERFGQTLKEIYGDTIHQMTKLGLLEKHEHFLKLTDKGVDVSNRVLAEFLIY